MASDYFIAADQNSYFQPFLFKYANIFYQLIPGTDPSGLTPFPPIQMWKSTDGGVTWTAVASSVLSFAPGTVAGYLLGTKLYVFYQIASRTSAAGVLAYFDFTTDTFVPVTTTGTVPQPNTSFIAGPDPAHIYLVQALSPGPSLTVGEFVSNAFSSIGSLTPILGAGSITPTAVMLGASGILHILYTTSPLGVQTNPSSLAYCNVQSGSLVGTTGSTVVISAFSDGWADGYPGTYSQPVQIGSNILWSYYDTSSQQVKLLSFNDGASPSFSTSAIDPSFPITTAFFATGAWTTSLSLIGSTLYCFYTNFSTNNNGDGWLYLRTSTDGGATWSARKQVVQHLDAQNVAVSILIPQICQPVGGATFGSVLPVSYRTNVIG